MDRETIQTLLDLLDPLHGSLDRQFLDNGPEHPLGGHPDDEHDVLITTQQERDLTQAVCILEDRLRQHTQK
jgi:hypothetical protein